PERMIEFAKAAANNGTKVIIAGAGGAAHLPGMVAACTHLPVIGVPIQSKAMSGIDSLYSIVQMPQGVPVATVAINGAHNAALLALQILALLADNNITEQLINYKRKLKEMVENKANEIEQLGYKSFLEKS
nr:5-(carboxyamino)imidazole ribonucleotide mutase [Chitinophagales bacterium]